jgi:hypothetical protein
MAAADAAMDRLAARTKTGDLSEIPKAPIGSNNQLSVASWIVGLFRATANQMTLLCRK